MGWLGSRRHPSGIIDSPERLHFRRLLAALAPKPVHILGSRPHHLVCLQLGPVLCTIHLRGRENKGFTWESPCSVGLDIRKVDSVPWDLLYVG